MYRETQPDTNAMPNQEFDADVCPVTGAECPLRNDPDFDPNLMRQRPGRRPYYYHRPYFHYGPYYHYRPYPYYPIYPYYPTYPNYPYPYYMGYSEG